MIKSSKARSLDQRPHPVIRLSLSQCSKNIQNPKFQILNFQIPNFQIPNFQILIFKIRIFKPKIFLNLTLTPKIVPKGPKRAKMAPNLAKIKVVSLCK